MYAYVKDTNTWTDPMGLKGCTIEKAGDDEDYDFVLKISKKEYPQTTKHIQQAIKKGKTDVVTINRRGAAQNRKESLKGVATKKGKDRDEWPMAMFKEGGKGASVKHIDPSDNRGAGSSIKSALSGVKDGKKVKIIVVD